MKKGIFMLMYLWILSVCTALSELPAFLTNNGGLNSGFMIAHCTAAALGMVFLVVKHFQLPHYKMSHSLWHSK